MKDNNLTLLLVLKDRPYFTERLMRFMSFMEYPFKVLIADGGKNKEIENSLKDTKNYDGLDYSYVRYPYDKTIEDFYQKMSDVVDLITTPITSVIDNDDFLLLDGYHKALKILKENPNCSSARGWMTGMQVMASNDLGPRSTVCGPLAIYKNMYDKYTDDIIGETAKERVTQQTKQFHGNWHNLTRTNHIQACWKMLNIIRPKNMRFPEQITGYLNTIWGDSYRGNFPWMLHQNAQRITIDGENLNSHFPEQREWVSMDSWAEDFNKMTELMGVAMAEYDGTSVSDAMNHFSEVYPLKLSDSEDKTLTTLFRDKITEAKKLGYSDKRIKDLQEVVKKYNVKDLPEVEEINFSPVSSHLETTLIANFIMGGITQYDGTQYPYKGKLLGKNR